MNTSNYQKEGGRLPFYTCPECKEVRFNIRCPKCKSKKINVEGRLEYEFDYDTGFDQEIISYPPEECDLSFKCKDCHHQFSEEDRVVAAECHALVSLYIAKMTKEDKDYLVIR